MTLLVKNKVKDVAIWKEVFAAQTASTEETGMKLTNMWQSVDQPDQVFFTFEVENREKAEAYMAKPESAEVCITAGVIDGEFHFLDSMDI